MNRTVENPGIELEHTMKQFQTRDDYLDRVENSEDKRNLEYLSPEHLDEMELLKV